MWFDGAVTAPDTTRIRTAIAIDGDPRRWPTTVDYVREAERLGVDAVWTAEAWGADAVTPLAYLAGVTERILLGTGIMQVGVRSPVMVAQTAICLSGMSGGRFLLGLGASGPQVMEGLHGVRFDHPLRRMVETLDIIAMALAGERIRYEGRTYHLPLPGGEGKALRLAVEPTHPIPVYLATLSPRMLELTGERADGWLGTSFVPEAAGAYLDHIAAGARRAGRSLADIDISQGAEVAFAADEAELARMIDQRKRGLAFTLGGMGSAQTNFYNRAYARQGFAEAARRVQQLWVEGRREEAAAAVPDEMVLATTLIGTPDRVRDRLADWIRAGVTMIRLYPAGASLDERVDTLGRALDLLADARRKVQAPTG